LFRETGKPEGGRRTKFSIRRSIMLTDRIIGALTFRQGVYAEVEQDTTFTTTAWTLVAVVAFLNQLGTRAGVGFGGWVLGTIGGTILSVIGFAVGAWVIDWVGRTVFDADVTFDELVRTLGLAHVWQAIGVVGIVAVLSPALGCILAPIMLVAAVLMIAAWFVAAKEALDLEWGQTIVTVIIGLIPWLIAMAVAGWVVGLLT
jgi:hypothetical protein